MYVKIDTDGHMTFPYGVDMLRRDNPNTSFPERISDERLADYGVFPVVPTEIPQPFDPINQNASYVDPVLVNGVWMEGWVITPASSEEIAQRTADMAQNVRSERDALLAQCDWTQLPDSPADKPRWAAYRAKLREVTDQPGFPTNVVWPTF